MKKSFFDLVTTESRSYYSLEGIEQLLQEGMSLKDIPFQPLYAIVKKMNANELSELIPRLSVEQRYVFQSLDLWDKDVVDVENFSIWIYAFNQITDEKIKNQFVKSAPFLLYLKGQFNIWTFDVEEPEYPDHDNYFLTDDNLLLFEFHQDYDLFDEVRALVRQLYSDVGVENAYTFLFKMVSEDYLLFEEDEYQQKKSKLNDYGFVDYFEALEKTSPFPSVDLIVSRINTSKSKILPMSSLSHSQSLSYDQLRLFQENSLNVKFFDHLLLISDERKKNLHFDFIKLVNSVFTIENSLKKGSLSQKKSSESIIQLITLGSSFISKKLNVAEDSIFTSYTFTDLFKVGKTLLNDIKKKTHKGLRELGLEDIPVLYGDMICRFFSTLEDESFQYVFNYKNLSEEAIVDYSQYLNVLIDLEAMLGLLKHAQILMAGFQQFKNDGVLNSHLYLNYSIDEIDFEPIIISMFANYVLEIPTETKKLGLSPTEFRHFLTLLKSNIAASKMRSFVEMMDINTIPNIEEILLQILDFHLSGYEESKLTDEEFKHVGGVIIFNTLN